MPSVSRPLTLAAVVVAVSALAACATKPAMTAAPATPQSAANVTSNSIVPGSVRDFTVNVGDTIHFDYNAYNLTDEDRSILQRQAQWLQKYSRVRVTIEGHCDERGTREYNLALGARRADATRDYLISLGVSSQRMTTIPYGKERPICTQSDEECWRQNRRGVTTITGGATTS